MTTFVLSLAYSLQNLRELKRGNGKNLNINIANTSVALRKEGKDEECRKNKDRRNTFEKFVLVVFSARFEMIPRKYNHAIDFLLHQHWLILTNSQRGNALGFVIPGWLAGSGHCR